MMHKIVVILGTTASGKSDLAMQVAQQCNGEIICADSRTVYKGMDIGTAKPTLEDQKLVPHHCLDIVKPDQVFSAAQFQHCAKNAVADIESRGKLPIVVGGSGLYIDGFVYDFSFAQQPDEALRMELEHLNLMQLQQRALLNGISEDDSSFYNHRHLSRLVERTELGLARPGAQKKPDNILLYGLSVEPEQLALRIEQRVNTMFSNGFLDECRKLVAEYGSDAPGLLAPGYKASIEHIMGIISEEECKAVFVRNDKRLAKRQRTWFRRNNDISWFTSASLALQAIQSDLNK
jgi:tRNA dimethylallyltransferase